jgi:hypothetical protein
LTFRPKHDIISILQTAYNWHLKNDKQKTWRFGNWRRRYHRP